MQNAPMKVVKKGSECYFHVDDLGSGIFFGVTGFREDLKRYAEELSLIHI